MLNILRTIVRNLPTLFLAFILAVTVWISAVSSTDPITARVFPRPVQIEVIGQDPGMLLTNDMPDQVTVTLRAPSSVWDRILNGQAPVRAFIDLSGLKPGSHTVQVKVQPTTDTVRVVSYDPSQVSVDLEAISSQSLPIHLVQRGDPAVGYQAATPVLSQKTATVTGPQTQVSQVTEVRAVLDLNRAQENIQRSLNLQAVNAGGNVVNGVAIDPTTVDVKVEVTQRGGYRNVVVKPVITGQVAPTYRVTNISVFPPAVTVFSSDPRLVDQLPGYVETAPLDLNAAKDDIDVFLPLNLPAGVSVVGSEGTPGDKFVEVQVSIAAIEGSLTMEGMRVEVVGLGEGLRASVSPEAVTVILSGPLPMLDQLTAQNIRVTVDVTGQEAGTYQLTPHVDLLDGALTVESVLPSTVEVTITTAPRFEARGTPTPTPAQGAPTSTPTATTAP